MRNLIVFGLVAVATVIFASTSATAVVLGGGGGNSGGYGGGGGSHGGGHSSGKETQKYHIQMKNKDHHKGMACWIRPKGEKMPHYKGQLRAKMMYIDPYATKKTGKMKKGWYECSTVCSEYTWGNSYDNTYGVKEHMKTKGYYLDKHDKHLSCDEHGQYDDGHGGGGYGGGGYGGGYGH